MVLGNICLRCDHQAAIIECSQCLQKHYCSVLCERTHRRQIGQLCPNQRGNTSHRSSEPRSSELVVTSAVENTVINRNQTLPSIVRSDRNQLHDIRSSELVVPIVVVNTVSFPSLVHTETRSIQHPVEQYSPSSRLPVLQRPSTNLGHASTE